MKIASYLDFNLQAYQERLGLVNFLDAQGLLAKCSPSELDKVANYLLYAEDGIPSTVYPFISGDSLTVTLNVVVFPPYNTVIVDVPTDNVPFNV